MGKWKRKIRELSLSKKIALSMMITPVLSGMIFFGFHYGFMKDFYREKVEIFQKNNKETMTANMENMLRQIEYVADQVLGMAVLSNDFSGYSQKSQYERLLLNREVNSQLINISISNEVVDNIYILDFDGNSFTSNGQWDKQKYMEVMDTDISRNQRGRKKILPPHPAKYRFLNGSSSAPYMISFVTYLNRYTQSSAIGLIQIDISYEKIKEAMEFMEMTEQDFSFVVDEEGKLIYAPDEDDAGRHAGAVEYGGYCLGEIWENIIAGKTMPANIQKEKLGTVGWTLIQINSDALLEEEMDKMQSTWILMVAVCLLSAVGFSLRLSKGVTRPITNLIGSMGKVSKGNFNIQVELPENRDLAELVLSFNTMIQEVDSLMKENIQKEHEKTRMEMMALNAKINSHFLYNTLNTIKWQAIACSQTEIAESIVALTKILEYSCKNTLDMVTLAEELQFVEDYIFIQNIRYGSHVTICYQIEEECRYCLIPKMILQPVVENALLHAFDSRQKDNTITVICKLMSGTIKIEVFDNGKGFRYEGLDKLTGIGLTNVKERLYLHFGEQGDLKIESTLGEGTCVSMEIPDIQAERIDS